jgi:hypothetical protein
MRLWTTARREDSIPPAKAAPAPPPADEIVKSALYSRMGQEDNRGDEGKWSICAAGVPGEHRKLGGQPGRICLVTSAQTYITQQ